MPLTLNAHRLSLNTLSCLFSFNLLLIVALSLPGDRLAAQTAVNEPMLEPSKPVERELAAGQVHAYQLTLAAGQYLHVVVVQQGIDVVVRLSGPDGRQLVEVDSLNGTQGPEPLFCIAAQAGTYRLEVRPLNKPIAAGRYKVRTEELRTAKEEDKQRIKAETLFSEATLLRNAGTKESLNSAVGKFAEAATHFHSLNDTQREVLMLNFIGFSHTSLGDKPKALSSFTQALTLAHAAGDRNSEGVALSGLGTAYGLGEPQKGLESFSKALPLFRGIGDSTNQAGTLVGIGLISLRLRDLPKALESYSQALPLARAVGERGIEARSLAGLGYVYLRSGERQKALNSFNEALPIARSVGDRISEADALAGLGLIQTDLGDARKGSDYLLQSLPLFRAAGDREGEAVTLNNLGLAYSALSDKQKAFDSFTQALPLARAAGDRSSESKALAGMGVIYVTLGESQKSLDCLRKALSIAREIGDRQNEADALAFLGYAYGRTGDTQKAIESFTRALPILHAVGDRSGEALALALLGFVYLNAGDVLKAQVPFAQALKLAREIGNPMIEAQALNGLSALSLGDPQQSRNYLTQSLALSRGVNNRGSEADALNAIGFTYFFSDDPQKALDSFIQALNIYRALNDRQGEAIALVNLALVERTEDNLSEARVHIEAAIAIFESLRTKIINQEGRTSYFASAQDYYKFYIDLLMHMHSEQPLEGYDGEALKASELSRARALLDTLTEANADIREGVDPQLLERERSLQRQLNARAQDLMQLPRGPRTGEQAKTIAKEIEALTTAHEQVKTEIRQTSPRYAALTQPQALMPKEIQAQLLDDDTLLLEYSLGSNLSFLWDEGDAVSYLWAVTSDSIKSYEIASRNEIESAARSVYSLLNARNERIKGEMPAQRETRIARSDSQIPAAAAALSQLVLAPVAGQLGKKRMVIVADGMLQYIPFAMLPAPTATVGSATPQPLIVEHEIVSLPSASMLPLIRREVAGRKRAPKAVVALADPVFTKSDGRIKSGLNKGNGSVRRRQLARAQPARASLSLSRLWKI